jgi:hypothetical protein
LQRRKLLATFLTSENCAGKVDLIGDEAGFAEALVLITRVR